MWFGWNDFEYINNAMYFLRDYIVFHCKCALLTKPEAKMVQCYLSSFFTILISSHIYWTSFVNNVLINFKLQYLPPFNRREYHRCPYPGEGEKFELKLNVESF